MPSRTHRAIWLSDVHLGSRDANVDFLLDFLKNNESHYLYLVGDIIDLWKRGKSWHWPRVSQEIVELILRKAKNGTKVIYIPGNHDETFRRYSGHLVRGVEIQRDAVHTTADGRRFLIVHGDEFDPISTYNRWLAKIGDQAYQFLLCLNRYFNICRRQLGWGYWSLSAYLKHKVKEAVNFIGNFQQEIIKEAQKRRVSGLICGHIHHASFEDMAGILYRNTGDWVESCTALVEGSDGSLQIVHWTDEQTILYDEKTWLCPEEQYENCYHNGRLAASS